ncbi:MAG: DUF1598 domain-containing protein [Pirellulales bacterium]
MRMLRFCLMFAVLYCGTAFLQAQSTTAGGDGGGGRAGGAGNDPGGNRGGAAMADFTTLMTLIQQTITPDSWLDNGGSDTMFPYPSGVYVDPKGQLKRSTSSTIDRTVEDRVRKASRDASKGKKAWQAASDLRMVSLKRLDQALVDAAAGRSPMMADIIRLGGINKVSYILIDQEAEDVILAGPADPNQLGFFLEDLAVVCALVNKQTAPLGCSIEPNQQRLLATQQFLSQPNSAQTLSRSPAKFAEQLGKTIGDYDVEIFGMNPKCGTAVALLAADEQMKMLGFGKVSYPVTVKSYFNHLETQNNVPTESMIRWWFAYNELEISTNATKTLFGLPENCVRVLSEQQFVTKTGRAPTGKNDPAADAFAAEMSDKMNELRNYDANFSRLCCVFESAIALQVALEKAGMADFKPWFPNLVGLGKLDSAKAVEPKTVPGLVTTHFLKKKKTNVAVISGGVTVNPKLALNSDNIKESQLLTGSAVPAKSKVPESKAWWWD